MTPPILVMTQEEYLASKGYGMASLGDLALHRLPGLHPKNRKRYELLQRAALDEAEWSRRRQQLRKKYLAKAQAGEIRLPTRVERLTQIASGHSDLESVQAARRILSRMGITMEEQE